MDLAVILAGAGEGRRMEGQGPKLLLDLEGKSFLQRAALPFLRHRSVGEIVAVVPEALVGPAREALARVPRERVLGARAVAGGATRRESVRLGLEAIAPGAAYVAVHDVARPLVTTALIDRVLAAARTHGAAIPALPIRDSVKEVDAERIIRSLPRERLRGAQTPQIFSRAILLRAHTQAGESPDATDDAALVEALGFAVFVVAGESSNLKITEPSDLIVARALIQSGLGGEN
ncbi:MAG TPA: 2-C-methyl-D-erythritol 4-phosphate cytidylyltransferase [Candidatus Limnocylindrales bacterium]|nr:2-C-methyl-D-erythritol 4-phosphate cytidylyltransferase [Candidatus Limnocylindrales bacterium]